MKPCRLETYRASNLGRIDVRLARGPGACLAAVPNPLSTNRTISTLDSEGNSKLLTELGCFVSPSAERTDGEHYAPSCGAA